MPARARVQFMGQINASGNVATANPVKSSAEWKQKSSWLSRCVGL